MPQAGGGPSSSGTPLPAVSAVFRYAIHHRPPRPEPTTPSQLDSGGEKPRTQEQASVHPRECRGRAPVSTISSQALRIVPPLASEDQATPALSSPTSSCVLLGAIMRGNLTSACTKPRMGSVTANQRRRSLCTEATLVGYECDETPTNLTSHQLTLRVWRWALIGCLVVIWHKPFRRHLRTSSGFKS